MPYKNFHSCRLQEPSLFKSDSFRTLHTKTKGLSFITAILKKSGKSVVQSFRYNKKYWKKDRATSHCSSHKGKFEAAAIKAKMMLFKKQGVDFDIRNEKVNELVNDALCLKEIWKVMKLKNIIGDWTKEEVSEYYKKVIEVLKKKKYPIIKKDLTSSDISELLKPGGNTAFQSPKISGLVYKLCMIEEIEKGTPKNEAKKNCKEFKK